MKLTIYEPAEIFLEEAVVKVKAEGPSGCFTLLPRHIDLATALVPGILSYETPEGDEVFLAVKGGILVKQGARVAVATQLAVRGDLGLLTETIETLLVETDERERKTRAAVARLEADFVRRFMEFRKHA